MVTIDQLKGYFKKRPWLAILAAIYIGAMIAYAVPNTKNLTENSDFYFVFWHSGKDFSEHHELYYRKDVSPFYYLPFAAFVFQPVHLIPVRIAAFIFFLINALIIPPLIIYLLYRLLKASGVKDRKAKVSLILVTLFSLQYFWNNIIMFNINALLFVFTLTGIYYLVRKKPHIAGIFFTVITLIKILPVMLAAYVFFFHFSRKVVLNMLLTVVICLTLPIPFRGMEQWVQDHKDHYENVFRPFILDGEIVAEPTNHNLKAGLVKTFHPESRTIVYVNAEQYPGISILIHVLLMVFLAILVVNGVLLYRRKVSFSLPYMASILLFAHLMSGLTWAAHMVTMMFCLLPVALIEAGRLKRPGKIVLYVMYVFLLFLGFEGTDTFGLEIYRAIRAYDVYTYLMIGLFFFYSWLIWNKKSYTMYAK